MKTHFPENIELNKKKIHVVTKKKNEKNFFDDSIREFGT